MRMLTSVMCVGLLAVAQSAPASEDSIDGRVIQVVLPAQDVDTNATLYYHELAELLEHYQIPHALVFGNHDDADYEERRNPKNTSEITNKRPAKTTRQQLATTMME